MPSACCRRIITRHILKHCRSFQPRLSFGSGDLHLHQLNQCYLSTPYTILLRNPGLPSDTIFLKALTLDSTNVELCPAPKKDSQRALLQELVCFCCTGSLSRAGGKHNGIGKLGLSGVTNICIALVCRRLGLVGLSTEHKV